MLYSQDNKRFDREYWEQLKQNWLRQKGKTRLERIEESRIEEWNKEEEIGNLWDPYDKLQKKFSGQEFLREKCKGHAW